MGKMVDVVMALEQKVNQLLAERKTLVEENEKFHKRYERDQSKIAQLKEEIDRYQQRTERLKNSNALLGSKEYRTKTKLKINNLIRELDECIVQLDE